MDSASESYHSESEFYYPDGLNVENDVQVLPRNYTLALQFFKKNFLVIFQGKKLTRFLPALLDPYGGKPDLGREKAFGLDPYHELGPVFFHPDLAAGK